MKETLHAEHTTHTCTHPVTILYQSSDVETPTGCKLSRHVQCSLSDTAVDDPHPRDRIGVQDPVVIVLFRYYFRSIF